ncbi:MAG: hypothetical protein RBT63_07005, partial [Bdellovibrionales bacterium]|nr:hypothetical protein [Bdellovibrionales bacterium]
MTLKTFAFSRRVIEPAICLMAVLSTFFIPGHLWAVDTSQWVRLESINYNEVCGRNANDQTVCTKGDSEPTWVPDTVGNLKEAYLNDFVSCGIDEVGAQCWRLPSNIETIDGLSQQLA